VVVGVLLVGGVVAWKLAGSTYRSDVEAICNAEKGSGYTVVKDQPKVIQWVREHLSTPEGNEFFSSLSDAKVLDRAKKLQGEADSLHVRSCPIVASYQALAAEGEYRADLQRLCSSLAFPKLAEMDDAGRLAKMIDYIDTQAKSPRSKELEDPLRQAASPVDRAKVLRDAANKMDIFSCETAKTLESPQAQPKVTGPAMVRVRAQPQINGPVKQADLATAIVVVTPAMNECYRAGLDRKADLGGKLTIKVQIDPDGNVTQAMPLDTDGEVTDRQTVACIAKAIKGMKLAKNPGPLATALLPLELTTSSDVSLPPNLLPPSNLLPAQKTPVQGAPAPASSPSSRAP
jgi:hypothetical protein